MAQIKQNIRFAALVFAAVVPVCAVNLGGLEVPRERFVVYLLIGHSNMAGIDIRNSDDQPHPRGWNYRWQSQKDWIPAMEERGSRNNGLSGRGSGGPGMPFLKGMIEEHPEYWFGVVSNASLSATCNGVNQGMNGSDLDAQENRYWPGATLYQEIVTAAKSVRDQVTLGGILCMLGSIEVTRATDEVRAAFAENMAESVLSMRRDIGIPDLPFLMGEYEQNAYGPYSPQLPNAAAIAEQIRMIPELLVGCAVVPSAGIPMLNDHHYTASGQGIWASRAVEIIRVQGFFPPEAGFTKIGNPILPKGSRLNFLFRDVSGRRMPANPRRERPAYRIKRVAPPGR